MSKADFLISKNSRALIIQKKSKFELDLETYGSIEEYKRICDLQNNLFDRIFDSHLRQEENRKYLQEKVFPKGKYIFRDDIFKENQSDFEFVVSLGGDNHFTYVAHESLPSIILGCNSDPETSVGALLGFTVESLEETILHNNGVTFMEEWTVIFTTIYYPTGEIVQAFPAVSEISIRNNSPDLISRYIVSHEGLKEEQKSSGLLIYTGAGSTGWVASCYPKKTGPFPKNQRYFQVYAREPRRKDHSWEHFDLIDFRVEDQFEVISEMNGGISIDSLTERNYPFPPGTRAVFSLGEQRLRVLVRK
jgi:NAD kinase